TYVATIGLVDTAVWARRSAFSVFILPSVTVSADIARLNPPSFNFVTVPPSALRTQVIAQLTASYDLFTGGQKLAELSRSGAALEGAHAGELAARFAAALLTESDYYAVLAGGELPRLARELPLTLADAITQAATQGPQYRVAQANERAAAAAFRGQLGTYLPRATLTFNALAFDTLFYPSAFKRTTFTLGVSFPIWDNAQREIALSQARVNRDVARAIRQDMDRAVQRDVTAAYDGYTTARASTELAGEGRRVARENFRVQQTRYRTGATTILDLLKAQSDFDDAEAALV